MKLKIAKLGNVWTSSATLFDRNGKEIATCLDTPNAIAYAMNKTGATMAKGCLGYSFRFDPDMADRIATSIGHMNNDKACLIRS